MNAVAAAFVFAPALALGSFLNVVAARVPLRRSIVRPPSACMSCSEQIAWYDNVPVVSYALLKASCRSCHASISWRYPAIELMCGALFAMAYLYFGPSLRLAAALIFLAGLVAITWIDLDHQIIPDVLRV